MDLKIIVKKLKVIPAFLIRHIKSSSIFISIILVGLIGLFLYFNFYQTIISAKKIIVLQADVSPAIIKIHYLEKIQTKYLEKLEVKEYDWNEYQSAFKTIKKTSGSNSDNTRPTPNTTF